jgi:(S)-ureidoglycine aminohydrolase
MVRAEPVASIRYAPQAELPAQPETLLAGESTLLEYIEVTYRALSPHSLIDQRIDDELLFLVRTGQVSVTVNHKDTQVVGPASVALIMPGDQVRLRNESDEAVSFYLMRYRAKEPAEAERGAEAGGSLVVGFDNLEFQPHDRGGLYSYFDRATAMTSNFEMHVTRLDEGITSHPPHTHRSEEIILMIHGKAEELINGEAFHLKTGELVFLDSMVPHGIRNRGSGTCMYFAFQWR